MTLQSNTTWLTGDCLPLIRQMPTDSVDLVFTSPPYEDRRTYGIDFCLKGESWVSWMQEIVLELGRVCKGLIAVVCQGKTDDFRWSAVPMLLAADLHRAGCNLRNPAIFHRIGIPGSGGDDWLRGDAEPILCITRPGPLPWSDNTALGHHPLWAPGGAMSHRLSDGQRRNLWGGKADRGYVPPVLANPGNLIHCAVGGNVMGDKACHDSEAPFPEALCDFFILSFCPPSGVVLDPFVGSGTTCAMAKKWGRRSIGIDIRSEQIAIAQKRVDRLTPMLTCFVEDSPVGKEA